MMIPKRVRVRLRLRLRVRVRLLGLGLEVRGETCVEAVEREVVRGEAATPAT